MSRYLLPPAISQAVSHIPRDAWWAEQSSRACRSASSPSWRHGIRGRRKDAGWPSGPPRLPASPAVWGNLRMSPPTAQGHEWRKSGSGGRCLMAAWPLSPPRISSGMEQPPDESSDAAKPRMKKAGVRERVADGHAVPLASPRPPRTGATFRQVRRRRKAVEERSRGRREGGRWPPGPSRLPASPAEWKHCDLWSRGPPALDFVEGLQAIINFLGWGRIAKPVPFWLRLGMSVGDEFGLQLGIIWNLIWER